MNHVTANTDIAKSVETLVAVINAYAIIAMKSHLEKHFYASMHFVIFVILKMNVLNACQKNAIYAMLRMQQKEMDVTIIFVRNALQILLVLYVKI